MNAPVAPAVARSGATQVAPVLAVSALRAIGASRLGLIPSAVVPASLPLCTATSLFAPEKSVRGSAALGLVGADGIGADLKVAFDLFNHDEALAIILLMLGLVIAVEQGSGWIRRKLI